MESLIVKAGYGRLPALDMARGLAACAVVFLHVCDYLHYNSPYLATVNGVLINVRMPLLLLISGTLTAGYGTSKIADRCRTMLWLLLMWSPILSIAHIVGGHPVSVLTEMLWPNTEIWYIWALVLFTATVAVIPQRYMSLAVVATLVLHYAASYNLLPFFLSSANSIGAHQLVSYAVYFYIGVYGSVLLRRIAAGNDWRLPVAMLSSSVVLSFAGIDVATPVAASLAVVSMCSYVARSKALSTLPCWLGGQSSYIYLGHVVIVRPLLPFVAVTGSRAFIITPLVIALAIVLKRTLERCGMAFLYKMPSSAPRLIEATSRRISRAY